MSPAASRGPQQAGIPLLALIGEHDLDIVPHFLAHYRELGVGSFQVALHGTWPEEVRRALKAQGDICLHRAPEGAFDEVLKQRILNEMAQPFRGQWVITADADEFLELPLPSLERTVAWLERMGANALSALVVQRHTATGNLPEVRPDSVLPELFPRYNLHLAEDMGLELPIWKLKFPLARVTESFHIGRGSHLPPSPDIALHLPLRAAVHHFKWRAALHESLGQRRGAEANESEQAVYRSWLVANSNRLPTAHSRQCSTRALQEQGILVRPTRAQLRTAVRRADARASGTRGTIALVSFELNGPDRSGGIGTAIGALAEALSSQGHRVHVLYCPYHGDPQLWHGWYESWRARGVELHYLPRRMEHGRWPPFGEFSRRVAEHLGRLEADVLHFVDADAYGAVEALMRELDPSDRRRIVTTMHGCMSWHRRGNLKRPNSEEKDNTQGLLHLLRASDVVCYPSAYMQRWAHEHLTPGRREELVLPNCMSGTSRSFRSPSTARLPVREIVLFGRLEWRKGLARFAASLDGLEQEVGPIDVTLLGRFGDGVDRSAVESLFACRQGALSLLTRYDSLEAINYLKARDCVAVIPSTHDNSPYTVYECLEAGVPLLTSTAGGIPELVHEDDHQRTLVADTARSLRAGLRAAVHEGLRPARLAFDPAAVEQRHLELHARLVEQSRSVTPAVVLGNEERSDAESYLRSIGATSAWRSAARHAARLGQRLRGAVGSLAGTAPAAPAAAPHALERPFTSSSSLAILLYHSIADRGSRKTTEWRVTPSRFEQQLAWLRDTDHRSLSLPELQRLLLGEELDHPRSVLLTFDDAYLDFHTHAWPLLQEYGFGALVFAVTARVGKTSSWDRHLGNDRPLMSWPQLRSIADSGIAIGSHAHRHVKLSELPPSELAAELNRSREMLESELGEAPLAIAYPYGASSNAVLESAERAGYMLGFGTRYGRAGRASSPFDLERITVTEQCTPGEMARMLAASDSAP